MGRRKSILITCEHGGNQVPEAYRYLFRTHEKVLDSHKGWDPGALVLARYFATKSGSTLFYTTISRLLVEANRSDFDRDLFSEYSEPLSKAVKKYILERYYYPYRRQVEDWIIKEIGSGAEVIHFSIHTFTPVFNGQTRCTDLGILFDDSRKKENHLTHACLFKLQQALRGYQVDANKPYLGTADGFTTYLRTKFSWKDYSGIEIEISQRLIPLKEIKQVRKEILRTIIEMKL